MSLLLDALKKSEAQRRRDASPTIDLTRTPPSSTAPRSRSRWWFILAAGVVLVAAAPWLWPMLAERLDKHPGGDEKTSAVALESNAAVSDADPEARSANQAFDRQAGPAPVAGSSSQRPTTVDEMVPEVDSVSVAERGAESDSGNARIGAAPEPGAGSSAEETQAGATQSRPSMQEMRRMLQEQHEAREQAKAREQDTEQEQRTEQSRPQAARQAQEPRVSRPSEASAEPSRPAEEPVRNFIRPWEMPQVQRADFPELDLAVHFYAERPADRFVLINGERYGEGQLVETGVRLVEIRQRGAVVEFAGYRILIE